MINLSHDRLAVLTMALSKHTFSRASENPTLGCCWDADRYDILRLFRRVKPELLSHPGVATRERLDVAYYEPETVGYSWIKLLQQVG